MFGELVKSHRARLGMSLREFCRRLGEDPSNWSKVERGILKPPRSEKKLRLIAEVLGIGEGSGDWEELEDLAAVGAGRIPGHVMENRTALNSLTAVFRKLREGVTPAAEMEEMIERLMKGLSAAPVRIPAGTPGMTGRYDEGDGTDREEPGNDEAGPASYREELTRAIERAYMKDAIDDTFGGEDLD